MRLKELSDSPQAPWHVRGFETPSLISLDPNVQVPLRDSVYREGTWDWEGRWGRADGGNGLEDAGLGLEAQSWGPSLALCPESGGFRSQMSRQPKREGGKDTQRGRCPAPFSPELRCPTRLAVPGPRVVWTSGGLACTPVADPEDDTDPHAARSPQEG